LRNSVPTNKIFRTATQFAEVAPVKTALTRAARDTRPPIKPPRGSSPASQEFHHLPARSFLIRERDACPSNVNQSTLQTASRMRTAAMVALLRPPVDTSANAAIGQQVDEMARPLAACSVTFSGTSQPQVTRCVRQSRAILRTSSLIATVMLRGPVQRALPSSPARTGAMLGTTLTAAPPERAASRALQMGSLISSAQVCAYLSSATTCPSSTATSPPPQRVMQMHK
jgi:hypothetical protein